MQPDCDWHWRRVEIELDKLLSTVVNMSKPDYFVLGTVNRQTYRRGLAGAASLDDVKAHTSDFKSYWKLKSYQGAGIPKADPETDALANIQMEPRNPDAAARERKR